MSSKVAPKNPGQLGQGLQWWPPPACRLQEHGLPPAARDNPPSPGLAIEARGAVIKNSYLAARKIWSNCGSSQKGTKRMFNHQSDVISKMSQLVIPTSCDPKYLPRRPVLVPFTLCCAPRARIFASQDASARNLGADGKLEIRSNSVGFGLRNHICRRFLFQVSCETC